jgi:small basic protein (TIGR04137 family)
MSIHPSLSSSDKDKKQRSVLKRTERLRIMQEKEQWKEGDSVYGLPKIKTVRIKIKKEKVAVEKPEAGAVEGVTAPAAPDTKEQAASPAKGTSPKAGEKEKK